MCESVRWRIRVGSADCVCQRATCWVREHRVDACVVGYSVVRGGGGGGWSGHDCMDAKTWHLQRGHVIYVKTWAVAKSVMVVWRWL